MSENYNTHTYIFFSQNLINETSERVNILSYAYDTRRTCTGTFTDIGPFAVGLRECVLLRMYFIRIRGRYYNKKISGARCSTTKWSRVQKNFFGKRKHTRTHTVHCIIRYIYIIKSYSRRSKTNKKTFSRTEEKEKASEHPVLCVRVGSVLVYYTYWKGRPPHQTAATNAPISSRDRARLVMFDKHDPYIIRTR